MSESQPLPKYIQISERLIREIAAGHFADGARLPPERELAADLGIAVGTLRKSLGDLETKGLLERVQGSGNYVRHKPEVDSVYAFFRLERFAGGGLPTAEVLSVERLPKPNAPDFGPSAEGHRIRRLRRLDADVVALEEIWLDGGLRNVITKADLSDSLYLYYREKLGVVIASVVDRIGVAETPDWADGRFGQTAGASVGYIERIGRTSAGDAVEYSRTWFDMDKARYVSRMGKG
ncbi:transcriptional regulator, GntR family [Cognatiyoonia koreensis]|uniref:Transcriptional regulator, GntR family n=1 Tax=Cognatiyoonia koreensis TaxID=364200 RepID=A0A1I0PUL0_9RHOB|nr:GntR family transcriptional regulator [Cognatiyoonia koreensis]SEW18140.1 transcriptional regulator, GntR family [Cognatiyoonia koreensis]